MKYINLFDTQAAYDAAEKYYPNVSYIEATDEVVYQENDPYFDIIVAKFTTTTTNQNVKITTSQELFSDISIDGVDQTIGTGALNYTFAVDGEYVVEYRSLDTTTIGDYAFHSCGNLTSMTIPDSVTTIGQRAFQNCSGLISITIPDSVTSIGVTAFSGCTGLTNITIPDSVTRINNYTFSGCTGLTNITIPDSVIWIGSNAFDGCSGLTSVTIGNSVTSIGGAAFNGCNHLTSVTIPNSVTSIGVTAFFNCTSLTSITSLNTTPPTIQSNTFQNVPATCPIYVPAASVDAYKAANYWSTRADYIQAIQ